MLREGETKAQYLKRRVRQKWKTNEEVSRWFERFSLARYRKKVFLFNAQERLCFYCRRECFLSPHNDKRVVEVPKGFLASQMATLEHLIPLSEGGFDEMSNLRMACIRCNSLRGTSDWRDYQAKTIDRIAKGTYFTHGISDLDRQLRDRKRNVETFLSKDRIKLFTINLAIMFIVRPDIKLALREQLLQLQRANTKGYWLDW